MTWLYVQIIVKRYQMNTLNHCIEILVDLGSGIRHLFYLAIRVRSRITSTTSAELSHMTSTYLLSITQAL